MNTEENTIKVLKAQRKELESISFDTSKADEAISSSEKVLRELGYEKDLAITAENARSHNERWIPREVSLPDWSEIVKNANAQCDGPVVLEDLFSEQELKENYQYISRLTDEYNSIHKLDSVDITICAVAGILSSVVDIVLVGTPGVWNPSSKTGSLSEFVRQAFERKYPKEEMEKLAGMKAVKTPYDAQDNRNTIERVEGLSSYYHRLYSLGHDPLLGFIFGVKDILNGTFTTIDANGRFVTQVMDVYENRRETNIFAALSRHLLHLKSDITTPAGLPAPLMSLFNLCQFGSISEEKNTIADIVRGMYYEGYDFIQFCASSIPVMLTEVIVRMCWAIKKHKEGAPIKKCIPCSLDRAKNPKLATMLFISHSIAASVNAGKVFFTKNPMAINIPQWYAFASYSFKQLKWNLAQKPALREKYVNNIIENEQLGIIEQIDNEYNELYLGLVNTAQCITLG